VTDIVVGVLGILWVRRIVRKTAHPSGFPSSE